MAARKTPARDTAPSAGRGRGGTRSPKAKPAAKTPVKAPGTTKTVRTGAAVEAAHTGPVADTPGARKHPRLGRWIERIDGSLGYAVAKRFIEIDLMAQSAALSLYALISLAPLVLLVLWLTGSLVPTAQDALLDQLADLAGDGAREVAATVIAHGAERPDLRTLSGLWNTLVLFVAATVVFAHLQATLNLIFATDARQLAGGIGAWLRKRVFSFGVVFALGFLLLVSTLLAAAVQVAFAWLPPLVPVLGNLLSLGLYTVAFALLYHYLPDRRVHWKQAFLGGGITASLFVLGRWAIGLYVARAAPESAYGTFGALVLMLVWMYYAALVFFTGALLTAVIDERLRLRREGGGRAVVSGAAVDA
jgi:membrane protein